MSQYTAEQVEQLANALPDIYSEQAVALGAYAATLKAAQGGVTDQTLREMCRAYETTAHGFADFTPNERGLQAMRAALEAALPAEPAAQGEQAAAYAEQLARALWRDHYADEAPHWEPMAGDLMGLLTQIDNMVTGWTSPPAQPAERVPEFGAEDWMRTHAHAARKAMLIAVRHGEVLYPVIDDPAFWRHEINALDKAMLAASPAPSAQPDSKVIGDDSQVKPAERVPEGWMLVPIKPTQAMIDAMEACEYPLNAWDEALAASPAPSEGGKGVDVSELRRAVAAIRVVGQGYDLIRRESVLDIIDQRLTAAQQAAR